MANREKELDSKIYNKSIISFKSLVYMISKEYGISLSPGVVQQFKEYLLSLKEGSNPWYSFCTDIMGFNTRTIALANIIYFLRTHDNIFIPSDITNDKVIPYIGNYIEESDNNENGTGQ